MHLRLEVGETVTVEDLGSTNGTILNGLPLKGKRQLRDGDELTLGNRTLRVWVNDSVAFEPADQTPLKGLPGHQQQRRRRRRKTDTLQGIGVVSDAQLEQTCPSCGPVPFNAESCPVCGVRWPRGRRHAPTHDVNQTVGQLRRNERYSINIGVQYSSGSRKLNGVASNLSETGVFIATRSVDPVGTRCWLVFIAPDGERSSQEGFVRRVIHKAVDGRVGMGIEFGRPD